MHTVNPRVTAVYCHLGLQKDGNNEYSTLQCIHALGSWDDGSHNHIVDYQDVNNCWLMQSLDQLCIG